MIEINGEQVVNVPNTITATRIIGSAYESFKYATTGELRHYIAAGAWLVADVIDGPVARKFNQETEFGAQMDPVGDKITIAGLTISAAIQKNIDLPVATTVGFINTVNAITTLTAKSKGVNLAVGQVNKRAQFLMNSGAGLNVIGNHMRKHGKTKLQKAGGQTLRIAGASLAVGTAFTLGVSASAELIRQSHQSTATITTE